MGNRLLRKGGKEQDSERGQEYSKATLGDYHNGTFHTAQTG